MSKKMDLRDLSVETIRVMLSKREDEKLIKLLHEKKKSNLKMSRLETLTLKLLHSYKHILKHGYDNVEPTYKSMSYEYLNKFYEAINFRDYRTAFECGKDAIDIVNNKEELNVYLMILEDIVAVMDEFDLTTEKQDRLNEINKKIGKTFLKQDLMTNKDIEKLKKYLSEKYAIHLELQKDISFEYLLLNIIDVIEIAKEKRMVRDDFSKLYDQELSLEENLKICLLNGDYISAYEILENNNIEDFKHLYKKGALRVLFILLDYLINTLKENEIVEIDNNLELEKVNNKSLDILEKLLSFINEKNDYISAYQYLLDNDLHELDEDFLGVLYAHLAYLGSQQYQNVFNLYTAYEKASQTKNIDLIRKRFNKFISSVKNTCLDRDFTYQYQKFETIEKDIQQETFQEKEEYYTKCLSLFRDGDYDGALYYINKYIQLDNDLNIKGYVMRAKIYEKMERYDLAQEDYLKSITIRVAPYATYKIAINYQHKNEFDKALEYMLLYTNIKTFCRPDVYRLISCYYELLNEPDKSKEYNKIYERVLSLSKK